MERRRSWASIIGIILICALAVGAFTAWSLMGKWNRASQALSDIPIPPEHIHCVHDDNVIELVDSDGGKMSLLKLLNPGFKGSKLFTCGKPPIDTLVTLHYKYTKSGQWIFEAKTVALASPDNEDIHEEKDLPDPGAPDPGAEK